MNDVLESEGNFETLEEAVAADKRAGIFYPYAAEFLKRQLAAANERIAELDAEVEGRIRAQRNELDKQNAALDKLAAEREARRKAEESYKSALGSCRAAENERDEHMRARLRADAGAAVMRRTLERMQGQIPHQHCSTCSQRVGMIERALSTDTGSRLAAVIEEARKMPCDNSQNACDCRDHWPDQKEWWCLRCRLVEAMGEKP